MADRTTLQRMAMAAVLLQSRYERATVPALDTSASIFGHVVEGVLRRVREALECACGEDVDAAAIVLEAARPLFAVSAEEGGVAGAIAEYCVATRRALKGVAAQVGGDVAPDLFVDRGLLPHGCEVAPIARNHASDVTPPNVTLCPFDPPGDCGDATDVVPDLTMEPSSGVILDSQTDSAANVTVSDPQPATPRKRRGSSDHRTTDGESGSDTASTPRKRRPSRRQ
jgi:hypothetical protein